MKKTIASILILVLLCGVAFTWLYRQDAGSTHWIKPSQGPLIDAVYGLGTVTADKIFNLKLGITSTVKKLYVYEGDEVEKGARLVQLADLPLVRAPFAGVITALELHKGETIFPQSNVLTLKDLKQRYILVSLEQQAAIRVRKGQTVKVSFDSAPQKVYAGQVISVYPNKEEFYVKISVADLPESILPEMTADVAIEIGHKTNALLIPIAAIHNHTITIKRGNQQQQLKITTGLTVGKLIEITSDNLRADDHILVVKH